jgi:hypothetical protein
MTTTAKPAVKRKRGRPTSYNQPLADTICAGLIEGKSLRTICAGEGMPARVTVLRWLAAKPDFRVQYAQAREIGIDTIAELAIDEATGFTTPEDAQLHRLRFDARRWYAGKLSPKKYGDKVTAEVSGPDGRPLESRALPPPLVPKEVAVAVRRLIANAEAAAGLPPGKGDDAQRLRAVLSSGAPIHPDLYEVLWNSRDG